MRTSKIKLIVAALAALVSFPAFAADHANCPMAGDSGRAGCCSSSAAKPMSTAFAMPPAAPMATDAKQLGEADAAFLARYEHVHAALAADDFAAAQTAATGLDGAEAVAAAKDIAAARVAFKALSEKAVAIARGHDGFYVVHCPMVKGGGADWVQTTRKISNPYFGKKMLTCGTIKE